MLREFYRYIANEIIRFFFGRSTSMGKGERYCLRLDTADMVKGVNEALKVRTAQDHIQGVYNYEDVYETFTIKVDESKEVVIASKINGMTDDFLATLRNAQLTENCFPILMITDTLIDTITSGTGDLSAKGMPFHAETIIHNISKAIITTELQKVERELLKFELENKTMDRFSDRSSLFEYSDLLTVLGRGYVKREDFASFSLLFDDVLSTVPEKKMRERLENNRKIFNHIDQAIRRGSIDDELEKEFDSSFIKRIKDAKKNGERWNENITYEMAIKSKEKLNEKTTNPLCINDEDISAYSKSELELEYPFYSDEKMFVRSDGTTKVKQRKKNIIIYNPDYKKQITIRIQTNIRVRDGWISTVGSGYRIDGKILYFEIDSTGCTFSKINIEDPKNKIKYEFRICVIDVIPNYLESIQTSFVICANKKIKKCWIQAVGINKELVINPGKSEVQEESITDGEVYTCEYNQTLILKMKEDLAFSDSGTIMTRVKCGSVEIPLQIKDEKIPISEITGIGIFKEKYSARRSLQYINEKVVSGTVGYFVKSPIKEYLAVEEKIVQNSWLAVLDTDSKCEEKTLQVPDSVRNAYLELVRVLKERRLLPSLTFYNEELIGYAERYLQSIEDALGNVHEGQTLTREQNDLLLVGTVIGTHDDHIISFTPLHPLNVLYQMTIIREKGVGEVRRDLVEKLTSLYLLPYIKDDQKNLYRAVEQNAAPEWNLYARVTNKRYHGARAFVQRLVSEKIFQYQKHFPFLFEDIRNDSFLINLINMGDCREIIQGIILYYSNELRRGKEPEKLKNFIMSIYAAPGTFNYFSVLSDRRRMRKFLFRYGKNTRIEDYSEMEMILGSKIKCFYLSPTAERFNYAHLTFYEMENSNEDGDSRMGAISSGISLGGITSVVPSVLNADWYKTGFGTKNATNNRLIHLSKKYNALFRVAFSGSSYEPESAIFTSIAKNGNSQLQKIYDSSNWVVFVDPKVDLSFFAPHHQHEKNLMIIHYSDQFTSASGYDDITVTKKIDQYEEIIREQLLKKGVNTTEVGVRHIINLFNAVNGGWMLKLISSRKLTGAADSNFSREKMSILSAIKVCMAYFTSNDIIWVPISLEEMLRVSGGAGYSQNEGLLSAKNLGFQNGSTSDDILMVGIGGPPENIQVYLHPVEVKIGLNEVVVLQKAHKQVINTYHGLWNALCPEENSDCLECKLSRNFLMQIVVVSCEKIKLYDIFPEQDWEIITEDYREALFNDRYTISDSLDHVIGKGTVISFRTDAHSQNRSKTEDVCLIEFPEKMGSEYMVKSVREIKQSFDRRIILDFAPFQDDNGSERLEKEEARRKSHFDKTEINVMNNDHERQSVTTASACKEPVDVDEVSSKKTSGSSEKCNISYNCDTRVGMEVLLGTDVSNGQPVIWHPNDTNQLFHTNTGIIGTMGTGKTQFTKSLITQLFLDQSHNVEGMPLGILIFDYKGDYNEMKEDFVHITNAKVLKPYHLPFNPLSVTKSRVFKPLLPIHTANAFKDTISKVYSLGPKQQNSLFSCITRAYAENGIVANDPSSWENLPPTFKSVYDIYDKDAEIKKNDSLAAAMEKLNQFEVFESDSSKTVSLFELLNGVVVIDLSGYDSDIQNLIVSIMLDLFYGQMQARGSSKMDHQYRQITKLILVDEADNFMSEGFVSLKKILKEGREFGVGTILSTQFLKHFGASENDYSKYILSWIVHNVADLKQSDVEFVFKTEAKSAETLQLFNDIKALQKHCSIVKLGTSKPQYVRDKAFWELYQEIESESQKN